jgi:threonine aldolase
VETDECGAPEFFSNGSKLLIARGDHGRLDPGHVAHLIGHRKDIHYPPPRALSLSQSTELGTVYRPGQLAELCSLAKSHGMKVHMDGARFANALAFLDCPPAEVTWKAGIDVLCFGGTKLGMAVTEAVVFFHKEAGREFAYRCKQAGQLCSKMRYISAQWLTMLRDGAWHRHAAHANRMACLLAEQLAGIPGVAILHPVESNAVFCQLPLDVESRLQAAGWRYYNFIAGGGSRLMCSWNVTEQDVRDLAACARGH